jgi:Ulp1 family protease
MSLPDCRIEYIPTFAILSYENMGKLPKKWYWNLGEAQMILVPAHLKNNHWGMAVIDGK